MTDPAVLNPSVLGARRDLGCTLAFNFLEPSLIALQIAPATGAPHPETSRAEISHTEITEELTAVWGDNAEPIAISETSGPHNGRVHLVEAPAGPVTIAYAASVVPPAVELESPLAETTASSVTLFDNDLITALRQSRYCPSDAMASLAFAELGTLVGTENVALAVADWVHARITYQIGASGHTDTAIDTLLSGRGVCRDFAHLMISLCRALGVPARMVSVYAPGLYQMDFHAVVEVWVAGRWLVVDPTRLAPRSSLVRIATGRDAADTAFAATIRGGVDLNFSQVYAIVEGPLPDDDHAAPTTLAYG